MTAFMIDTLADMRGGRQSWRVITSLSITAFAVSFVLQRMTL